ncbi:MAG: ArsR family transcriptional regulator [Chloroflexi bacterium RBG_13_50_21]|nr:MAG: ArsR family transcriptional regulator [Chloroflexi bacterium RBG_13_50_21]OGO64478.1 MAG: ArsR family transcriptional regulator [Chloroflexi bacterium RBG_19FT_COMBO_47_9]
MNTYIPPNDEQLLTFFKALADANRLKIVGLLSEHEYSVEHLAALLNLRPPTVSHHLKLLADAGLVSARAESYYNLYQLETDVLEKIARHLGEQDKLPRMAAEVDLEAYDRKILRDILLPDGRLKVIPAQRKKREVILRHILNEFKPGVRYSEQQVNEILSRFHDDTATLRREMITYKLMKRAEGEYWRIDG